MNRVKYDLILTNMECYAYFYSEVLEYMYFSFHLEGKIIVVYNFCDGRRNT